MLRRSSRISNRKILKTEGGDGDGVASIIASSSTARALHGSSSVLTSAEKHPLENAVILRHLFELCPTDVLATCRLVCKQWYDESLIVWRNSTRLTFAVENGYLDMKYIGGIGDDRDRHTVPLENFLEYVADPKNQCHKKPYRNIRLQNSTIDFVSEKKKQFDIFWTAFGSTLTTLELKKCTFLDDEEFRKIIFIRCPKLECLIIDQCRFSGTWDDIMEELGQLHQPSKQNRHLKALKIVGITNRERELPVTWLELFSHFPQMSSLTLSTGNCYEMPIDEDFDSLVNAIRTIRKKDGNLLPFKVIDVGAIPIPAYLSIQQRWPIFQQLCLPIQTLYVNLESEADRNVFKDNFSRTCHQLDAVLKLCFKGSLCHFFEHMTCLKFLPNLEELQIRCSDDWRPPEMAISNTGELESTHLKMMKLSRLTLACWLKDEEIAKLSDWMPNVTDLLLNMRNNGQFGIVCRKWKNLKNLEVFGFELTDDGVMGLENETGADITNLQYLEQFAFLGNELTATSLFDGFLKLPNLRVLVQFGNEPLVRWGKRARRALLDKNILLHENHVTGRLSRIVLSSVSQIE